MSEKRIKIFEQIVELSSKMLKLQVLDVQKAREDLASKYEEYLESLEPEMRKMAIVILMEDKMVIIPRTEVPKVIREGKEGYKYLIKLWGLE